jgi:excisionase family DNA binding protein
MLSRPLLTLHEVADLLKVKEATVRTWINNGSLRAIKFGREWRVAYKDLEFFVETHATSPSLAVGASARP